MAQSRTLSPIDYLSTSPEMETGNLGSNSKGGRHDDPYGLNPDMAHYIIFHLIVAVNTSAAFLGLVTNVLNLIVFYNQGFGDSVTICLTTVAFWDMFKCLSAFLPRIRLIIGLFSPSLAASWYAVYLAKLVYVHIIANFVTYPLAAYIAVERAVCVSFPFKVKGIFTTKFTSWAMGIISTIVVLLFTHLLFIFDLSFQWNDAFNDTLLVHTPSWYYRNHRVNIMKYHNWVGLFNPLLSLIIIIFSSAIISYHLKKSSEFRAKAQCATSATKGDTDTETFSARVNNDAGGNAIKTNTTVISKRDRQVIKMLLVVITMFVLNMIPRVIHQTLKMVEPEFYQLRRYHREFIVMSEVVFALDFINSSANFFIFIQMNQNFKATFKRIFTRSQK